MNEYLEYDRRVPDELLDSLFGVYEVNIIKKLFDSFFYDVDYLWGDLVL